MISIVQKPTSTSDSPYPSRRIAILLFSFVILLGFTPGRTAEEDADALDFLVRLSEAPAPGARFFAASRLGEIDDPKAFEVLIVLSRDDHRIVREHAAWSLANFGLRAIPILTRLLKDKDAETACAAAHSLSEIRDPKAVKHLIKALRDSRCGAEFLRCVSRSAAEAVVSTGSMAVPALLEELRTNDPKHKRLVVSLLSKIGDDRACSAVRHRLSDWDDEVRSTAVEALGSMGCTSVVGRLERYIVREPELRDIAARSISKLGAVGRDALIRLCRHDEINVRLAAITALGFTRGDATVTTLESALGDSLVVIRRAAAIACQTVHDSTLIGALSRVVHDQDSTVQSEAVSALQLMKNEEIWPAFSIVARDTTVDSEIRARALSGIYYIKSGASDTLRAFLDDEDPHLRRRAVWLILHVVDRGPECNALLYQRLGDSSAEVRSAALNVLVKVTDSADHAPLIPLLDEAGFKMRRSVSSALMKLCDPDSITPILIQRLDSVDRSSAIEEIRLLGKLGDDRAFSALSRAYERGSRDMKVEVLHAMGRMSSPEAMEYLIRDLKDEDSYIRSAARVGLSKTKNDAAAKVLVNDLGSLDMWVRIGAAEALIGFKQEWVIDALIDAVGDEQYKVRAVAAKALSVNKAERVVEAISAALEKETREGNPDCKIRALGKIRTPAATEALERACFRTDASAGVAAVYLWGILFGE